MNKLINNCYRGRTHSWFCTYIITNLERQIVSPAELSYVLWVVSSSFNLTYIFLMSFTFLDYIKYYDTLSAFVLRSLGISAESDSLNTCGLEVTALAAFYVIKCITAILTDHSYK